MSPLFSLCLAASIALGCANRGSSLDPSTGTIALSDRVYLEEIAPGIWRHVSSRYSPAFGLFPSNGLIVTAGNGALLVDTAYTPEQTQLIIDWTETWLGPIRGLIVTHSHDDRMGGIEATRAAKIRSFAIEATAKLAAVQGLPAIDIVVPSGFSLALFGIDGELFFPGAGHSADNAVVWLSGTKLLHAGCLIKSRVSKTLGNIRDADLASWPAAVDAIKARYPEVEMVVPGHGPIGDRDLLNHTLTLLKANQRVEAKQKSARQSGQRLSSRP